MYIHSYLTFNTYEEAVRSKDSFLTLYPSNIYHTEVVGPYWDKDIYKITIKRLSYVTSY
jgi:hypothetical protein